MQVKTWWSLTLSLRFDDSRTLSDLVLTPIHCQKPDNQSIYSHAIQLDDSLHKPTNTINSFYPTSQALPGKKPCCHFIYTSFALFSFFIKSWRSRLKSHLQKKTGPCSNECAVQWYLEPYRLVLWVIWYFGIIKRFDKLEWHSPLLLAPSSEHCCIPLDPQAPWCPQTCDTRQISISLTISAGIFADTQ